MLFLGFTKPAVRSLRHRNAPVPPFAQSPTTPSYSFPRSARSLTTSPHRAADFTHTIIGAGAVGLAIARRLQQDPSTSVLLLERHSAPGTETSSRNSEVIHAGLYYGHSSLKTRLCLDGKRLLYEYCDGHQVPYRRCGKWIVAQDQDQRHALERVDAFAKEVGDAGLGSGAPAIPLRWVERAEAQRREPDVRAREAVLESQSTGILDSHAYMTSLLGDFQESGGTVAFGSDVSECEALRGGTGGWNVHVINSMLSEGDDAATVSSETLINSAGLAAIPVSNAALPAGRQIDPAYAKGTYYSYSASHPRPSTLIYPAPIPGHGGLGTHLTLDLGGQVRFGPDVEWVDNANDLRPNPDPQRLKVALDDIQSYLPGLQRDEVGVDYCGIRPKLRRGASGVAGSEAFEDFYIRKETDVGNFVNLLGIESPGLTASLAIAEHVRHLLR